MSKEDLSRILSRALVDKEFSALLASDPDKAISAMNANLTKNERAALAEISSSQLNSTGVVIMPTDQITNARIKALEERLAVFDQQQQQGGGLTAAAGSAALFDQQQQQTNSRIKALEERLAVFDQQQQQGGGALASPAGSAALFDQQQQQTNSRLKALEERLAVFDQQQQQGGGAAFNARMMPFDRR